MIHVTIFMSDRHECMGFRTSGPAEMAESGKDIVCAATSMLIINTMNAIETYTDDAFTQEVDQETGMIEYHLLNRPTHDADLLLKAMILGLEESAGSNDYKKYIKVDIEEV